MIEEWRETHVDALLLQLHLPLDVFVVCALLPLALVRAVVEHEQELVRHLLLYLHRLIVSHEVERRCVRVFLLLIIVVVCEES